MLLPLKLCHRTPLLEYVDMFDHSLVVSPLCFDTRPKRKDALLNRNICMRVRCGVVVLHALDIVQFSPTRGCQQPDYRVQLDNLPVYKDHKDHLLWDLVSNVSNTIPKSRMLED